MGPLTCLCLVVLMAAPALQRGMSSPSTSGLLVSEATVMQAPHSSVTKSIEKSLKTASVTKKGKANNSTGLCQNNTSPVSCLSLSHSNYEININESTPCVFRCFYDPQELRPLRLEVHQKYKNPMQHPTFISVQQDHYISCWTLPIISSTRGENQKFTTLETLLCPPANESKEVVEVTVSVRGPDLKKIQIALKNVSFVLQKEVNVTVIVTPVSPWYKRYQWAAYEESVLVTADSNSDICSVLILQNAKCPVYSELSGLINKGRYQTFTRRAGMVAHRTEFPDGVHVIVLSLPDDDACILSPVGSHNNTRDTRTKTVVLEVYDHATISSTWYIFCSTAIILTIIIIVATTLISAMIKRTLSPSSVSSEDERPMLGESAMRPSYQVEVMEGMYSAGGLQHRQNGRPLSQENSHFCNEQEADGIERGGNEDGIGHVGRRGILALDTSGGIEGGNSHNTQAVVPVHSPSFLPATTHAPVGESMDINDSFNPRIVLWWKCVAVHEAGTAEAQVSEVGFQNSLIIMGVFAALPTSELLRSYLSMVLHHGKEDQCFWNSRCLTAFGFLPDFARVFTNYGYILLGVAFVIIVKKHKNLTSNILKQFRAKNSVGVTHCYGLFVSLGYGLIMQGVMSALYHTCPNSVTIKFDMMFMYVMMVVAVVTIWGLRHGDVTHHVYPTVITVGLALLVAEARMWLRREWFWGLLSTVYVILLLSNAVLMSTYGIWSFSLSKLWHVWSAWKPVAEKLKNVMGEQDTSSQPMQVARVLVGVGSNIGLIVYGNLGDPDVYNFILIVCLVNMGLYFANYVMMKKLSFEEKGTVLAWVCLAFSILLWIIALVFFFQRRSDSERSPADSRNKNSPCDFLHVFDEHDIWHITSSFALFFFFVALLTMDDDLCWKSSQEIKVT
ncbi:SID1 transmembrane family member 1-like [Scylla paramamosain]|uniref:SID1 transmembrane family member 1-like n=1 Tax=Scylla paramamosain TaxID=85552 RepID=UPI003082A80C